MRTALFAIALASLPALAAADPAETHCYAGAEKLVVGKTTMTYDLVVSRTLDPAASEIREEIWSSKDAAKSKKMTAKVDVKASTFSFEETGIGAKGTGTLTGPAWHWTGQTTALKKGALESTTRSTRAGDHVTIQATVIQDGKPLATMSAEATAFDCGKLAERVAALAKQK